MGSFGCFAGLDSERQITLCTHLTLHQLTQFATNLERWPGPVSAAVFLEYRNLHQLLKQLQTLKMALRKNVGLHLVFNSFKVGSMAIIQS